MRILHVTSLYLPWLGGLEVLASQLVAELRARGHETAVVTAVNDSLPLGVTEVDGTPVFRTDAYHMRAAVEPLDLLRSRKELRGFAEEFRPDVVHAHDAGPMLVAYQRTVRKQAPVLATLHNVMTLLLSPEQMVRLVRALRGVDLVTGVSPDVVADALSWAPWLAERISVVRNGVAPMPHPDDVPAAGRPELLCIGRLVPQKGFDRAIDAVARALKERDDLHLTIVGVGPGRPALHAQIDRLGLQEHVSLAGRIERNRLGAFLQRARAVIMPSRFEGLPLVALEAAWLARPVIGTDVPGLRCAVEHEVTGLLVPEDDTQALATALLRVVDDPELGRRLGSAARVAVERDHSLTACTDRYEVLYRQLAG